jgi:putative ABC transport system substrate-binding protein
MHHSFGRPRARRGRWVGRGPSQERPGLVVSLVALVFYHRANLGDLAVKKHLPAVSMFVEFAEAGGLLAYGPSIRECFRRAGVFAARILEGAKPADMPVERPTTFELVINRMTAKALGLTMPASIARRADRVIE